METIRVIVVDDAERDLRSIERLLGSSNRAIEVVGTYDSGKAAIDAAAATDFHVAVVDYRMPEMDGLAVAAALKQARPAAKVVILTAYDDARSTVESDPNVDHFQEKVDIENLDVAVRNLHDGVSNEPVGGKRGLFGRRR